MSPKISNLGDFSPIPRPRKLYLIPLIKFIFFDRLILVDLKSFSSLQLDFSYLFAEYMP
jgi:hypothetical protein